MVSLADDLIGEIRLGRGAHGPAVRDVGWGTAGQGGGARFSARARNLWRAGQGANSAVLKKIHRGGTHTAAQLGAQFDYLFSKSEAVFGNMVEHDPSSRGLSAEARADLAETWADSWSHQTKNGHTTHLLLSFPADLSPKKALHIAEEWAFEMFQSGIHADEEWAYVAALHTDRPNPHVHIVVNNRGIADGDWFFMAQEHVFNLAMMKERIVGIAAEMGVELDASSRLERGILTYGPSRDEIEAARREHRPVFEKMREGKALEDGLAVVSASAATLLALASIAGLVSLDDIATRMERAAGILEAGGIITPRKLEIMNMDLDTVKTRKDLDHAFTGWLEDTERQISRLSPQDRAEMRRDLVEVTTEIMRDLGDARGAELIRLEPRSELYSTQLLAESVTRRDTMKTLSDSAAQELRGAVIESAAAIGIDRDLMVSRLEGPAANAWQEREWVRQDLAAVSQARGLDLERQEDCVTAADLVDHFYATAANTLNKALQIEQVHGNDRLTRTLDAMAAVHHQHGRVSFEHEDDAARFTDDLKVRYGENVVTRIASGDDQALALDFPDADRRREIALAIVAAADSHESLGLSRRQAELAHERLQERDDSEHVLRRKDHDLEL